MARIGGSAYLLGAGVCTLAGWFSDRWIFAGATPSLVRKTCVGGGLGLAGILIGLAGVSSAGWCVALVIIGVVVMSVSFSNTWAITQTLAGPRAAGRWTGFQCFVGNLAGIVAPALTGFVVERTGHFYWAFVIVCGVALLGAALWIFLVGPIEQVSWCRKNQVAELSA
jgi:MFS family permease